MQKDVFISYAPPDRAVAVAVCAHLEAQGMGCWIASRDVQEGVNPQAAILDGLDRARLFVLMFSRYTNEAPQVKREIERATDLRLHVIPLRLDVALPSKPLEFFIGNARWVDAVGSEPQFESLTAKVRALLQ